MRLRLGARANQAVAAKRLGVRLTLTALGEDAHGKAHRKYLIRAVQGKDPDGAKETHGHGPD
jgi:sugar/nucleoside kinase (ribokinase family)